jgi:hypothetical protein
MFIPKKRLERAADSLLAEFSEATSRPISIPIPIEEILERHLGLDLYFEDLAVKEGPGVLGATYARDREVSVDLSIEPELNPGTEGRCRFTIAHEIAHWRLHDPNDNSAPMLCTKDGKTKKPPREFQADFFAGCLLMPREFVVREWDDVCAVKERHLGFDASNEMARRFDVSEQAMRIRLKELGIVAVGA